jgi:UBX domain-containing protein 1/4
LTASLATRNAEPVNFATTVLPAQGGSSTLENPSDLSSQSPDVSMNTGKTIEHRDS